MREKEAVLPPDDVYTRDVDWICASGVLIAEVSTPSHGVGYEIGFALGSSKPVLAIHKQGRQVSKMISGNPDANLQVKSYCDAQEGIQMMRELLQNSGRG